MSRKRYLSTSISQDARVYQLIEETGVFGGLLFSWMVPHANDDGTITGNPQELLMLVVPGVRGVTAEDVRVAVDTMLRLGLVEPCGGQLAFPRGSFYRYQSYVKPVRRRPDPPNGTPVATPEANAQHDKTEPVAPEDVVAEREVRNVRRRSRKDLASGTHSHSHTHSHSNPSNTEPGPRAPARAAARESSAFFDPPGPDSKKAPTGPTPGPFNEDLAQRIQAISLELGDDNAAASITRAQRYQAAGKLSVGQMANAIKAALRRTEARLGALDAKPLGSPMAYFLGVLEQTTQERMNSA